MKIRRLVMGMLLLDALALASIAYGTLSAPRQGPVLVSVDVVPRRGAVKDREASPVSAQEVLNEAGLVVRDGGER